MLVKFWSVRVMVLKYKREMNSERDSNILEIRGKAELRKRSQAKQGRRKQMDIGGGWQQWKPRGSGGMRPQIILKSRTPEIRFPASWRMIFYRKAHYKLEVWERVDRN